MNRSALDYQVLARDFAVGDVVYVVRTPNSRGRISAVFQGIGMVDVNFPTGTVRYPVEDLMLMDADAEVQPPSVLSDRVGSASSERVAQAFVKKAIYWASQDRNYKATRSEQEGKRYACPKCGGSLKSMIYKREAGESQRLYGCSGDACGFLVKPSNIAGCHLNESCDEGDL